MKISIVEIDALKEQLAFQFAQLKKSTLIKTNINGKGKNIEANICGAFICVHLIS